jgi:tRNA-modifying protein YgfZ
LNDRDVFFDLSERVKLRVGGNDRVRFLNGQLTADVRKATPSCAMEACVLNPKGKMNAHVFLFPSSDSFLLDADQELKGALQARLERYVIADDVEIEDVSDRLSIFHLISEAAPVLPAAKWINSARRFTRSGWDIWVEAPARAAAFQQLSAAFEYCDANCAEIFRIEQGISRWGRELTEEIIPVEANLEERAIDYEKGCYIGQEVISRMKMSGQRNKKLCGLVSEGNSVALAAGREIVPTAQPEKSVGWITSAGASDRLGKQVALGFVKRGFNVTGTRLEAINRGDPASPSVPVVVVDLPFTKQGG